MYVNVKTSTEDKQLISIQSYTRIQIVQIIINF